MNINCIKDKTQKYNKMEDLFNKLYIELIEEEDIKEDICNICHLKTTSDKVKLKCGHIYHKKCIKNLKYCPYCNKLIEINNICKVILKSGKNKGKDAVGKMRLS